jgi:hypothetical protein
MDLFGFEKVKPEETDFAPYIEKAQALITPVFAGKKVDIFDTILKLMDLEKEIIDKRGKNKNKTENDVLGAIIIIYLELSQEFDTKDILLSKSMAVDPKNQKLHRFHALSLSILQFANYLYEFNMPKDNFSSARKVFAIQLYCRLLPDYEIENKYDLINKALDSGKDSLIIGTADELANLLQHSDFKLEAETIKLLSNLTNTSKNRSVMINCTNALIRSGTLTEGGALIIIEDWKFNNSPYR